MLIYEKHFLLVFVLGLFVFLGIDPKADRLTWFLENAPVLMVTFMLFVLKDKIQITNFTLRFMALHAVVLMVGGHYTYAEVPIGHWVRDFFELSRNHYDRLGHFMQGFVPALIFRELIIKKSIISKSKLLPIVVVCFCVTFSAFYEFIEWWSALILGQGADAFLGTQGDPWDTQWDIFLAFIGAIFAVTFFNHLQDKAITQSSK